MHIAPLLVLMNATTPEEFKAIGQVLLFSYMPALNKAQSRTVTALSARQSIADLSRKLQQRYDKGRQDAEDELVEALKAVFSEPDKPEDPEGVLGRVRERLFQWFKANAAALMDSYKDDEMMVSILEKGVASSSATIQMMAQVSPVHQTANAIAQQQLNPDTERELLKDARKIYNAMRKKPKGHKLSSTDFDKMKILKSRLEQHDMLKEFELSDSS